MKSKSVWFGILGGALVGLAIFFFINRDSDAIRQLKNLQSHPRPIRAYEESAIEKVQYELTETGQKRIVGELTFEQKIALLREKWGKNIHRAYLQIKMIEDLMRLCQKEQPNDWVACVNELAGAAFPKLADKLFNQLSSLVKYNDWLTRNKDRLDKMSRKDRQNALAEMRAGLFGDDNAKEIFAAEIKATVLQNALEEMRDAKGKDLNAKLSFFKNTLNDTYGDQAKAYLERHQQEITNSVLQSVQADLRGMSPTQQRHALRTVRSEMGMDHATLERWDGLDHERQTRWESGKTYLAERQKVAAQGGDPAALNDLRKKYFGAEAEAIAQEESEGFYRYGGEQRIGVE
jgi:hypothetical protein